MTKNFHIAGTIIAVLLAGSARLCSAGTRRRPSLLRRTRCHEASTSAGAGFNDRCPATVSKPGDTFDVTFDLSPEFNQTAVAVQPDGFVTLRSVGDVKVAGRPYRS